MALLTLSFDNAPTIGSHLLSPGAMQWLRRRKMTCVLWNSVPGDFKDPHGWIGRALEDLRQKEHVLMVLHDARPESMAHLEDFLRQVGHSEIAQKISLTGRVMK